VLEAAFSDEVLSQGRNSHVLELSSTRLVVLRRAEHRAAQQQPLAEVKPLIERRLQVQAAQQQAANDAEAALAAIQAGGSAETWSTAQNKGRWHRAGFIGREAELDPVSATGKAIELAPELRQKVFAMPAPAGTPASTDRLTLSNGDVAVIQVYALRDSAISEQRELQYRQQLESALGGADYTAFIQELREGADISTQLENVEE
ncbi:MAG: hypothetical protein R6X06_06120, partial [Gammaproteobacteria bacterium]